MSYRTPLLRPAFPIPVSAAVPSGQFTVDFNISALNFATPPPCFPGGIQKPAAGDDDITILSVFAVNSTTLRAYLSAAPSVSGYTATVLIR